MFYDMWDVCSVIFWFSHAVLEHAFIIHPLFQPISPYILSLDYFFSWIFFLKIPLTIVFALRQ